MAFTVENENPPTLVGSEVRPLQSEISQRQHGRQRKRKQKWPRGCHPLRRGCNGAEAAAAAASIGGRWRGRGGRGSGGSSLSILLQAEDAVDGEGFLLARKWGLIRGGGFRFTPGRGEGGQRLLVLVWRRVGGGQERLERRQLKGDVMMMRHVRMMRVSSRMMDGQLMLHRWQGSHGGGEVGERHQLGLQRFLLVSLQPEPLPTAQQRTVLKHGNGLGMEGPVGPLARPGMTSGYLDEAVVEAEIVS